MTTSHDIRDVHVLPEHVANKIAAGEVVERPASVVKELVENALDAGATRISVRVVAAGRRLIEVLDNGHGMSEQNALLAVERHATSKVRDADDIDAVQTMGFRGEALASIAAVSHFVLTTRRATDEAATRVHIDGGSLREVNQTGAPQGTRVTVSRLYFNTPVRAKFLKGITTELSHCIDIVQRHALAREGVGFQFFHNEKLLLDVPERASLRERVALIWGLSFSKDMLEIEGERDGLRIRGLIGAPGLTRAQRSHQFFFINGRPVVNRTLQFGVQDGYRETIMIGRHAVCMLLIETDPRSVDVNVHPTKREVRFRDERLVHDVIRDLVRARLSAIEESRIITARNAAHTHEVYRHRIGADEPEAPEPLEDYGGIDEYIDDIPEPASSERHPEPPRPAWSAPAPAEAPAPPPQASAAPSQGALPGFESGEGADLFPGAVYQPVEHFDQDAFQLFDTYLLVPGEDRLLIIDQHALHERLNYDNLTAELRDNQYAAQELAVPIVLEAAPSQVSLLEQNLGLFRQLGLEIEPFGGNSFQVTAVCHLYDEGLVRDLVYKLLDDLAQGDLFDVDHFMASALRLATRACHASVRGGDRLTPQERRGLIEGFRRLRPPYTCPHGRPIIIELTQAQMEKSFGRSGPLG